MVLWAHRGALGPVAVAACLLAAALLATGLEPPAEGGGAAAEPAAAEPPTCHQTVDEYLATRTRDMDVAHDPQKFLFFLHVPRTGELRGGGLGRRVWRRLHRAGATKPAEH